MTYNGDGGPAFPVANGPDTGWDDGMSLRDYFAAKAMQGILSSDAEGVDFVYIASSAYRLADAMIAERKKL